MEHILSGREYNKLIDENNRYYTAIKQREAIIERLKKEHETFRIKAKEQADFAVKEEIKRIENLKDSYKHYYTGACSKIQELEDERNHIYTALIEYNRRQRNIFFRLFVTLEVFLLSKFHNTKYENFIKNTF